MLILYAIDCSYEPFLDYVKRSAEEQQERLFAQGLSKCDGRRVISAHQRGRAADLYLWDSERIKIVGNEGYELYRMLHEYWEMLGGKAHDRVGSGTF